MRPKVAGNRVSLPIRRKTGAANEFEAAKLWPVARRNAVTLTTHVGIGEVSSAFHRMVDSLAAPAVGKAFISNMIPVVAPGIAAAFAEVFHVPRIRIESPDPGAIQAADAI